jgi:hypothetical protein
VLRVFDQGPLNEKFSKIMYKDVCMMTKKISQHIQINEKEHLLRNEEDTLYTQRQRNFRNLQRIDKNFNARKEKVLWPLFEFNKNQMNLEQMKDEKKKKAA